MVAFTPRCGIIVGTNNFGNLVMINRDELEATYKVIIAAARQKGFVNYSELITLHKWPEDNATRMMGDQLNALVKVCRWRGWPAMAAIVVRKDHNRLTDNNLAAFVRGTRNAGYTVTDPEEFQDNQRELLYNWAPMAPDTLDLSDQEAQDLSKSTGNRPANDDSLIEDSDQMDNGDEMNAQQNSNAPKPRGNSTKDSAPHRNIGTPSDGNNEETIHQLREEIETLKKEQKKTDQTVRELQQEIEKKHRESLERTDSKFDKISERLMYVVLTIVVIIISTVGVMFAI